MELEARTLGDYFSAIKYRKKLVFGLFAAVFSASAALAMILPSVYRSSATILIEQPEIPADMVRTTVVSAASERVDVVTRRVMTTENLGALIHKYNLYPEEIAEGGIEAASAKMRTSHVLIEVIEAEGADPRAKIQPSIPFTVAFESFSPSVTQQVTRELGELYLAENIKNRTEQAAEISGFFSNEVERLNQVLADYETRLAKFKEENAGKLPELGSLNMQVLERAENDLREIDRQIRSAEGQRITLQGQLEEIEAAGVPVGASKIVTPGQRLLEAQTEYYALLSKYSEGHPDVVRARKELESLRGATGGSEDRSALEAQLAQKRLDLLAAQERYAPDHPDVRRLSAEIAAMQSQMQSASSGSSSSYALDPVRSSGAYIQIQTGINAVNAEISSLRGKQAELVGKRADFESRLAQSPQVEREYRELSRGYEASIAQLKDVQNKQVGAQLAENLENKQQGETFKLIAAPLLPVAPVRPNRLAILFLGAVFGLAAGIGAMLMADAMDDTVRGSRGVAALLNAPPLAVIPIIDARGDKRGAAQAAAIAAIGLGLAPWLSGLLMEAGPALGLT
ncbi:MAG: GumC family protein [Panacagrimonas sp.]